MGLPQKLDGSFHMENILTHRDSDRAATHQFQWSGLQNFPATSAAQHSYDTLCTSGSHTGFDMSRRLSQRYTGYEHLRSRITGTESVESGHHFQATNEIWIGKINVKRFQWTLPQSVEIPCHGIWYHLSSLIKKMEGRKSVALRQNARYSTIFVQNPQPASAWWFACVRFILTYHWQTNIYI